MGDVDGRSAARFAPVNRGWPAVIHVRPQGKGRRRSLPCVFLASLPLLRDRLPSPSALAFLLGSKRIPCNFLGTGVELPGIQYGPAGDDHIVETAAAHAWSGDGTLRSGSGPRSRSPHPAPRARQRR